MRECAARSVCRALLGVVCIYRFSRPLLSSIVGHAAAQRSGHAEVPPSALELRPSTSAPVLRRPLRKRAARPKEKDEEHRTNNATFERAFFINADASRARRRFMQSQLSASNVQFERWPAVRGGPELLRTHAAYFRRGVQAHLYANHNRNGSIVAWGTISTYLSHLLLIEHIVRRWKHDEDTAFLILQDDTALHDGWLQRLRASLDRTPSWQRVLLVWWGLTRPRDCDALSCRVRPPAGPTTGGAECCGKRFYHGLQAWVVRVRSLRCIARRLQRREIKNIDALMVECDCPGTYALQPGEMIGVHADRKLGSERAAVNSVWRLEVEQKAPKRHARRNMRKVGVKKLLFVEGRRERPARTTGRGGQLGVE